MSFKYRLRGRKTVRSLFVSDCEIRGRVMAYVSPGTLTVSEMIQPEYRGFLNRLVYRALKDIEFELASAARFDLGEIPDFMG